MTRTAVRATCRVLVLVTSLVLVNYVAHDGGINRLPVHVSLLAHGPYCMNVQLVQYYKNL